MKAGSLAESLPALAPQKHVCASAGAGFHAILGGLAWQVPSGYAISAINLNEKPRNAGPLSGHACNGQSSVDFTTALAEGALFLYASEEKYIKNSINVTARSSGNVTGARLLLCRLRVVQSCVSWQENTSRLSAGHL